jgi:hypothetical protein
LGLSLSKSQRKSKGKGEMKMICKNCGCGIKKTKVGFHHRMTDCGWSIAKQKWLFCCVCGCVHPEPVQGKVKEKAGER